MAEMRSDRHFRDGSRSLVRARWLVLSHVATFAVGIAVAVVFAGRALTGASQMGDLLQREPLVEATLFAYAWGSDTDASTLLGQYEAQLRLGSGADPILLPSQLISTQFQRAIVEHRSRPELLELCRSTAKCKPEKLDALLATISAGRKVTREP